MTTTGWIVTAVSVYFGLNFCCALILHLHADRQAHLRTRFLDVLVHFVLLTAFAIPALLVVTVEALFGGKAKSSLEARKFPAARAA